MPSEHALSGTGWSQSDFCSPPDPSEIDVECDRCDATTPADDTDGWTFNMDMDTYVTDVLCPECSTNE